MTATAETTPTYVDEPLGTVSAILGADLVGMISDLLRTCSKDGALPMITCVRLHTTNGWLHGWTTDRYTAAHARVEVRGALPAPIWVFRAGLDQLVKIGKRARDVKLTLSEAGDMLTATADGIAVQCGINTLSDSSFLGTLPDELPKRGGGVHQYQVQNIARFFEISKRRGPTEHVVLAPDENQARPTHVRIGYNYRAWLMPVRASGQDSALELPWLANSLDTELPAPDAPAAPEVVTVELPA